MWFGMHILVNLVVSWFAFPSLVRTLRGDARIATVHSMGNDQTPVILALLLHVYHSIVFRLSNDDLLHHILFVLVMGTPSLIYTNDAVNATLFSISGIPGAIIYSVIIVRRLGYKRISEPHVSVLVNVLIRLPLVIWVNTSYLSCAPPRPPMTVVISQVILSTSNALGYSVQAIVRARRESQKNKTSSQVIEKQYV